MSKPKTFRVNWATGHIEVNISNFFGISTQKEINKLLKLARVYCTDVQRIALLANLHETKQERIEAISAMSALNDQMQRLAAKEKAKGRHWRIRSAQDMRALLLEMQKLAEPFFTHNALLTTRSYEKALVKQCGRIENCISRIKAESWKAA